MASSTLAEGASIVRQSLQYKTWGCRSQPGVKMATAPLSQKRTAANSGANQANRRRRIVGIQSRSGLLAAHLRAGTPIPVLRKFSGQQLHLVRFDELMRWGMAPAQTML